MTPATGARADLRGCGASLRPFERRLDAQLEAARLALALLQRREDALQAVERQCAAAGMQQHRQACEWLAREPHMRPHLLDSLREVDRGIERARADVAAVQEQVAVARAECVDRQRRLACVQRLRAAAERLFAQEQVRRDAREADAAWLGRARQRKLEPVGPGSD